MPTRQGNLSNHLLAALPANEYQAMRAALEPVQLDLGEVIYESGGELRNVYFPTTAIVSLLYLMEDGVSAEIAVVGNDGIVGIALFMGGESMPNRAVVQSAGHAYRLNGRVLKEQFRRGGVLQRLLLRYTQALLTQMAQTAVCNRHHGSAAVPLAPAESGPPSDERADHDAGTHRQHAGRATRRRDRGSRQVAESRINPLQPWPHLRARSTGARAASLRMLPDRKDGNGPLVARRAGPVRIRLAQHPLRLA